MSTEIINPLTGRCLDLGVSVSTGGDAPPLERSKIVLVGKPGCGKSSLVQSCPDALVFDTQNGAGSVPTPYAFRWPAKGQKFDLKQALGVLDKLVDKPQGIRVVAIDLFADWARQQQTIFCTTHKVTNPGDALGGFGAGWAALQGEVFAVLDRLVDKGFGVVLTAHCLNNVVRAPKTGDLVLQDIILPNKIRELLGAWADHVLWMETGTTTALVDGKMVSQPVRIIRTTDLPGKFRGAQKEMVKTRLPLPDTFPIPAKQGWAHLQNVFAAAEEKLAAGYLTLGSS